MSRHNLVFALAGGLSIAMACGGGGSGDYLRGSYYSGESVGDASEYATLDASYTVPPDRAVIRIDAVATAPDAATAAAQLRARIAGVEAAAGEGCTAQVLDYQPARPDGDEWRSEAELRVDIPLVGLESVSARMDALDACSAALAGVVTDSDGEEDGDIRAWVGRTEQPQLLVDDRQQHASALLARRAADLAAVADSSGAPQLHPEDLRCTATGDVHYGSSRRLSGISLVLGMDCRVVTAPAPAAEAL